MRRDLPHPECATRALVREMALQQLGIETELISFAFLIILASICLGMALAIGLGAKDVVARKLQQWVDKVETEGGE